METYEQAMRRGAKRLIAEHGELVEVRCVSGPPNYQIELVFADGHEEVITQHSGRIDITMMKFGYMGTGTRCFRAFLDEAGFKDVSYEQLATMEGPQVLHKGEPLKGIDLLVELCTRYDILSPDDLLKSSVEDLKRRGEEGAKALASLLTELLQCRADKIGYAIVAAKEVSPVPELLSALESIASASPLTSPPARARFRPEIEGMGQIGWTDGKAESIRRMASDALNSLKQRETTEKPKVQREGEQPEEAMAEEEPGAAPGGEAELPLWADVCRDPSLVNPLILESLEKSMCFMVRDETGPVAALITRASPDEFRGLLTAETLMSLYIHHYKAPACDLYGVYPIVWDDPKEPFFKETWMVGANRVTGPPDPLSEGELSRLEALLSQGYTYFLIVDRSNHLVAARRVNYSPETQKHFLGLLPKVGAARSVTISNVELINALQEYMNCVSLEEVRAAARRLGTVKAKPKEEERKPVIRPEVEKERVYPWRGISKMYRVALVLAALVWLGLVGQAMNVAAQDPIVYLIFAVILLVLPARAIFEALRPTTMRELVISPEKRLIFRRKSGEEKPVIAQIDRVAETQRGKAIVIEGLSPEGKKVRAQIAKGNLEEGDFERFKEDLQRLIPEAKIVPTRALPGRKIFAGITALLGVLFLAAFLFTTAASVHDYLKGLEFERIPFQTQVVIILALLAAFLLFAGLSTLLSERRKIGLIFWSGLLVLGLIGTGYILAYVYEGGLWRTALPSVPPTATPVPRAVTFEGDGFSFEYPSNWEVITEKEIDVLLDTSLKGMSPGGYDYIGGVYTGGVDGCRGCAHIVVVSLKDPNLTGTLTDEQYEQVKASYENTMGSRFISIKRTEVSGLPGVEVVNLGRSKETKLRGVIIVPPEPGIAYSLNCLSHKDSFDDFEAIFSRAIESLRIEGVAPLTTTPSPAAEVITYTVQAGDTLGKIAAEFEVTVEAIIEANDIEDPSLINVGQVLVIPQP